MPRDRIQDADRVMPGHGVIPLREILRRLRQRGYDGPLSLELFHPGYWSRDPIAVAVEARRALEGLTSEK